MTLTASTCDACRTCPADGVVDEFEGYGIANFKTVESGVVANVGSMKEDFTPKPAADEAVALPKQQSHNPTAGANAHRLQRSIHFYFSSSCAHRREVASVQNMWLHRRIVPTSEARTDGAASRRFQSGRRAKASAALRLP